MAAEASRRRRERSNPGSMDLDAMLAGQGVVQLSDRPEEEYDSDKDSRGGEASSPSRIHTTGGGRAPRGSRGAMKRSSAAMGAKASRAQLRVDTEVSDRHLRVPARRHSSEVLHPTQTLANLKQARERLNRRRAQNLKRKRTKVRVLRAPDGTEIAKAKDGGAVSGSGPVPGGAGGGRAPETQVVSMRDQTARRWDEAQHNVLAAIQDLRVRRGVTHDGAAAGSKQSKRVGSGGGHTDKSVDIDDILAASAAGSAAGGLKPVRRQRERHWERGRRVSALAATGSAGSMGAAKAGAGRERSAIRSVQPSSSGLWGDVVEAAGKKAGLRHTATATHGQMAGAMATAGLQAGVDLGPRLPVRRQVDASGVIEHSITVSAGAGKAGAAGAEAMHAVTGVRMKRRAEEEAASDGEEEGGPESRSHGRKRGKGRQRRMKKAGRAEMAAATGLSGAGVVQPAGRVRRAGGSRRRSTSSAARSPSVGFDLPGVLADSDAQVSARLAGQDAPGAETLARAVAAAASSSDSSTSSVETESSDDEDAKNAFEEKEERKKRAWGRLRGAFAGVLWMIGMNKAAGGGRAAGKDSDDDGDSDNSEESRGRRPSGARGRVSLSRLQQIESKEGAVRFDTPGGKGSGTASGAASAASAAYAVGPGDHATDGQDSDDAILAIAASSSRSKYKWLGVSAARQTSKTRKRPNASTARDDLRGLPTCSLVGVGLPEFLRTKHRLLAAVVPVCKPGGIVPAGADVDSDEDDDNEAKGRLAGKRRGRSVSKVRGDPAVLTRVRTTVLVHRASTAARDASDPGDDVSTATAIDILDRSDGLARSGQAHVSVRRRRRSSVSHLKLPHVAKQSSILRTGRGYRSLSPRAVEEARRLRHERGLGIFDARRMRRLRRRAKKRAVISAGAISAFGGSGGGGLLSVRKNRGAAPSPAKVPLASLKKTHHATGLAQARRRASRFHILSKNPGEDDEDEDDLLVICDGIGAIRHWIPECLGGRSKTDPSAFTDEQMLEREWCCVCRVPQCCLSCCPLCRPEVAGPLYDRLDDYGDLIKDSITETDWFNVLIMVFILLAGISVGVQLWPNLHPILQLALTIADYLSLGIFIVEMLLKIAAEGSTPLAYFEDPWNRFDAIVVVISLLPFEAASLARLPRLMRVLKLVRTLPGLRVLVLSVLKSLASLGYVSLLVMLIMYLFAVLGVLLFSSNDPAHFRNLGVALMTLFRSAIGDDATDIMYIGMFGCDEYGYAEVGPDSILYEKFILGGGAANFTPPTVDGTPDGPVLVSLDGFTAYCTAPQPRPLFAIVYNVTFIVTLNFVFLSLINALLVAAIQGAKAQVSTGTSATVTIVRCYNLIAADILNSSDPFVRVRIGREMGETKIKMRTLNPRWAGETFLFSPLEDLGTILKLDVFDWDRFGAPDELGVAQIDLGALPYNREIELNMKLQGVPHGEIVFRVIKRLANRDLDPDELDPEDRLLHFSKQAEEMWDKIRWELSGMVAKRRTLKNSALAEQVKARANLLMIARAVGALQSSVSTVASSLQRVKMIRSRRDLNASGASSPAVAQGVARLPFQGSGVSDEMPSGAEMAAHGSMHPRASATSRQGGLSLIPEGYEDDEEEEEEERRTTTAGPESPTHRRRRSSGTAKRPPSMLGGSKLPQSNFQNQLSEMLLRGADRQQQLPSQESGGSRTSRSSAASVESASGRGRGLGRLQQLREMLGGLALPRTLVLDREVKGWVRANAGAGGVRWFKIETADDRATAQKELKDSHGVPGYKGAMDSSDAGKGAGGDDGAATQDRECDNSDASDDGGTGLVGDLDWFFSQAAAIEQEAIDRAELAEEEMARATTDANTSGTDDDEEDDDDDLAGVFGGWFFQNSALADLAQEANRDMATVKDSSDSAAEASQDAAGSKTAGRRASNRSQASQARSDSQQKPGSGEQQAHGQARGSTSDQVAVGIGGGSGWFFQPLLLGASQRSLGGKSVLSAASSGEDLSRSGSRRRLEAPLQDSRASAALDESHTRPMPGLQHTLSGSGDTKGDRPDTEHAEDMHHAVGLASHAGSSVAGSIGSRDDARQLSDATYSNRRGSDALSQRSIRSTSKPRPSSAGMPQWFFADLLVAQKPDSPRSQRRKEVQKRQQLAQQAQEGGLLGALGGNGAESTGDSASASAAGSGGRAASADSRRRRRSRRRSSDRVLVLMASAKSRPRRRSSNAPRLPSIHADGGPLGDAAGIADEAEEDILAQATALLSPDGSADGFSELRDTRNARRGSRRGSRSSRRRPPAASSKRGGSDGSRSRSSGNPSMDRFVLEAQAEADLATQARMRRLSAAVRGDELQGLAAAAAGAAPPGSVEN